MSFSETMQAGWDSTKDFAVYTGGKIADGAIVVGEYTLYALQTAGRYTYLALEKIAEGAVFLGESIWSGLQIAGEATWSALVKTWEVLAPIFEQIGLAIRDAVVASAQFVAEHKSEFVIALVALAIGAAISFIIARCIYHQPAELVVYGPQLPLEGELPVVVV